MLSEVQFLPFPQSFEKVGFNLLPKQRWKIATNPNECVKMKGSNEDNYQVP